MQLPIELVYRKLQFSPHFIIEKYYSNNNYNNNDK